MNLCPYRFVADIKSREGEPLAALPFRADFDPAIQWSFFQAVRQGAAAPLLRAPSARIRPTWHPELGEPRVVGFRVTVPHRGASGSATASDSLREELSYEIPLVYFRRAVEGVAAGLVEDGKLAAGEGFLYEVSAFPADPSGPPSSASADGFLASDLPQAIPLVPGDLTRLLGRARLQAADHGSELDPPLFITERVISQAMQRARDAREVESGGILIGHLHRARRSSEIFAAVTAFVPAAHTVAEHSRLTFTSETWEAVRAAIELRGSAETMLAWAHSHPFFCKNCDSDRRKHCALARPFFSHDDTTLHHTVFPAPFHTAILLTDLGGDDLIVTAYGWRFGMVMRRAYYVLPEMDVTASSPNPEAITHGKVKR